MLKYLIWKKGMKMEKYKEYLDEESLALKNDTLTFHDFHLEMVRQHIELLKKLGVEMISERVFELKINKWINYQILFIETNKEFNLKTGSEDEDEIKSYGITIPQEKSIFINIEGIRKEKVNYGDVLAHEIGHAYFAETPTHALYENISNAYADAFEESYRFSEEIKKIIDATGLNKCHFCNGYEKELHYENDRQICNICKELKVDEKFNLNEKGDKNE